MRGPVTGAERLEEGEMSETRLRIAFEGPGVEDGSIDVRDLAPALMAIGQLMQAAAKTLNGDRAQTSVRLQEVSAGSFIADLSIIQSLGEALKELFAFSSAHKEGIEAADGLADLIFKVGAGAAGASLSLFQLLKFLKGRKPEKVERLSNGGVSITVQGGGTVIINQKVERLYSDVNVRKAAESVARATQSPGIERLRFIPEDSADAEALTIASDDAAAFALPEPDDEAAITEEQELVMLLQLRKVWLTGETQKWDFTAGGEIFTATIEDVNFLNKVGRGEIAFAANDYMRARVRVRQTATLKGLKIERTVVEVLDHQPANAQLRLL